MWTALGQRNKLPQQRLHTRIARRKTISGEDKVHAGTVFRRLHLVLHATRRSKPTTMEAMQYLIRNQRMCFEVVNGKGWRRYPLNDLRILLIVSSTSKVSFAKDVYCGLVFNSSSKFSVLL